MYRSDILRRRLRHALWHLLLLTGLSEVRAGHLDDTINTMTDQTRATDEVLGKTQQTDTHFVAVPIPVVNPTLGNGLAATGLLTFSPDQSADPRTPRSTIGVVGAYTDTESWVVGAGGSLYLSDDRYRPSLSGGYGSLNLDYYGTGADSVFFDHPVAFKLEGFAVNAGFQVRVDEGLYVGMLARHVEADLTLSLPIDVLPDLAADFTLFGLGVSAIFDTRDNIWYPTTGSLGGAEFVRYDSHLGVNRTFMSVNLHYARYWEIGGNFVLAGDIRAATTGSNAPFFMFPYVAIRGFPAGRYLDQSVLQAQAEIRYMFRNGIGAVAFAGAGVAAPGLGELDEGSNAYGLGVGLRYQISSADRMNVGFDFAYGSSDEVAVYFRIGEAF